ncbi:MAG: 4Fe-4S binding protein [Chitinivibrionales bacterium]|nr:4Fe-4S binding protein [Chitinivibrionales bacterium]
MKLPSFYFDWLQKGNPTGTVDRFPELKNNFETSVPGIYCVGDLTGIPLIKLASESGYQLLQRLKDDESFAQQREQNNDSSRHDLVIIGAGPAGVSAGIEAHKAGFNFVMIESSQMFNTIINFPKGKPIYVSPQEPAMQSELKFSDGTKETLLDELEKESSRIELPIKDAETVKAIRQERNGFAVTTSHGEYKSLRVIVAIGKTGNARMLNVPGEKLPKVFTRLIDPGEHHDQDVLVVGGGDSAIEASVALSQSGNRVTHSYRRASLSRPKEQNINAFNKLVDEGKITPLFESTVKEIREQEVVIATKDDEQTLRNDAVYALIGTEIPIQFFKRSHIRMEGERNLQWWINLVALVSFAVMIYFGKSGFAVKAIEPGSGITGLVTRFLSAPLRAKYTWGLEGYAWYSSLNFLLGWLGALFFIITGTLSLVYAFANPQRYFGDWWGRIKYGYFIFVGVYTLGDYFTSLLTQSAGWVENPTFNYSMFYSVTVVLFGIRRIQRKPTKYIAYQTSLLMFVQVFFLFLLPFFLYEPLLENPLGKQSWLIREVFPEGKWSSFGLILFWPLNINNFGTSTFWTWFPFVQTFGILAFIVHRWGKGVYCGWICSCGALAETLGDEYRTLAPHGPQAKKMDNIGQYVLWFAFIATALHFGAKKLSDNPSILADTAWGVYKVSIDVVFAGVLGVGVYFFMGGRVWCRFGCPLAALMHIYTRFSPYRIMANKKRCISCNICTKVCHMGIDVMNYANKGIPMNDVECVKCSACVVNCPMQVLTFGDVGATDPDNVHYKEGYIPLKRGWESGLPDRDIEMLVEKEKQQHPVQAG